MRPLMLRWNRANPKFWRFSGSGGQGLEKVWIFTAKAHLYVDPRRLRYSAWKLVGGVTSRSVGKNKESNKHRIFHIFTQKPPLLGSSPNLFWGLISRTTVHPVIIFQYFTQKCEKLHYGNLNSYNFGTVEDTYKLFAPNRGFSGSRNRMVSLKLTPDWPLLPWQPIVVISTHNWP